MKNICQNKTNKALLNMNIEKKKENEYRIFNMAKQDISFLRNLELVKHDDRPDFVLKDENGRKIGLEHFRADVYRIQDKDSSHISGGHTVLNNLKDDMFQKYHPYAINNSWTNEIFKDASNDLAKYLNNSLNMQSEFSYNKEFLDNLRVGIHGNSLVKGHIEKSKNYPDREKYDLFGFLIEIPVPSFLYCFKNNCNYQKINGLPITSEIWTELNIFNDIDFVIIEIYSDTEHYGQYYDKESKKPRIYPEFSFGLTNITNILVNIDKENNTNNIEFVFNCNFKYINMLSITQSKKERRKQNRKTRKYFDEVMNQIPSYTPMLLN